jgi:hypothetical protein
MRHLRALARESWVPRSIESFSTQNGLNCLVKEAIERTLFSARISSEDAMRLGVRMLNITETLHKKFELNNRHAIASSWGYTKDGRRLVIANSGDLVSTSDFDAHGYHRVRELHQLGLTIRYLLDLDERFLDLNTTESIDPDFICSSGVCGPKLRRMIENLFAIHRERGDVPDYMYTSMRASLLSMVGGNAFSSHGYRDLEWVGRRSSASLMSAMRDGSDERIVLKCSGRFAGENIAGEYNTLVRLREESWVPKVFEFFTVAGYHVRCFSMEMLNVTLADQGGITNPQLGQIGVEMTSIIQSIHQEHGLRHGSVRAKN